MSVSDAEFIRWLGEVQADNADYVTNMRGLSEPTNILYVGRPRAGQPIGFGNPYKDGSRIAVIRQFTAHLGNMDECEREAYFRPICAALRAGKRLACWCAPDVCHAHVLAGWARAIMAHLAATAAANAPEAPAPKEPLRPEPQATPEPQLVATTATRTNGPRFSDD